MVNDAWELVISERGFLENHKEIMEGVGLDKNESWIKYVEWPKNKNRRESG